MEKLKPIQIKVFYEGEIKKIAKKDSEETVISQGLDFASFINFIFTSYPEIKKNFIPGTIAFSLNGNLPKINDILKQGDIVKISAKKLEDIQKTIEKQISEIIAHYQIEITFEEIKNLVFNEQGEEDFNRLKQIFLEKISNEDKEKKALQIASYIWNYFPHKALDGLCPLEKLLEKEKS